MPKGKAKAESAEKGRTSCAGCVHAFTNVSQKIQQCSHPKGGLRKIEQGKLPSFCPLK